MGSGVGVVTMQLGRQPVGFTDVRVTNLAVVLGYVRRHAPCSRADIATATGLNKATVSSLVGELIGRRLLRETGATERRIGRPATMIGLDGSSHAAVGLSVAADHLTVVALDLAGEQLLCWRRAFAGGSPGRALATVAALAKRALSRLAGDGRQVLGLTVGVPGLVDADGVVRSSPSLGWRDVPVRQTLLRALNEPPLRIQVENDANLAVLAEQRHGPYADAANLVYLGGAGLSAGIIAGGELVRGGLGYAGEIGHLQIDPLGPPCDCGRTGCLAAVASVGALVRRLCTGPGGPDDLAAEIDEVIRRARRQDPAVVAALRELGRHLGHGASVLANLLDPEVVILGGYYVPLAPWIIPAAQDELAARATAGAGGARLVASALGHDAPAIGGAAQVLDLVDAGQLPISLD